VKIICGYVDWMTLTEWYQIVTAFYMHVVSNTAVYWDVTL